MAKKSLAQKLHVEINTVDIHAGAINGINCDVLAQIAKEHYQEHLEDIGFNEEELFTFLKSNKKIECIDEEYLRKLAKTIFNYMLVKRSG